jgi:hypothetical protein
MAMTQHDSIFPNVKLPGGISSKATEWKEMGLKGDTWESPVFKLGAASTSTDIPKAPAVTRKDHSVTEGGVRGPQNLETTTGSGTSTGAANGTAGFSSQVEQAFSSEGTPIAALNGSTNGATNGATTTGKTNGGTTLGSSNPVLTGSV